MSLSPAACVASITHHSAGFATAARAAGLAGSVEHCPAWTVADLVWHLTEVQWFWSTVAAERPSSPPDEDRTPPRPPDADLITMFEAGGAHLASVLAVADPTARSWTWSPPHQDVGFIIRHQVQEVAVHHWDAAHAAGIAWSMEPAVAADAVDEFLDVSVDDADAGLVLEADDTGDAWSVGAGAAHVLRASASDLLLWLYRRVHLVGVPDDLLRRDTE